MTDPVVLERLLQDEEYWTRYREQLRETFLRDMKPIFLAGAIAGEKQAKRVGIARKHLSGKHDQQSHAPNKSGVTAVSLSDEQRQNTSEWMTANGISASSLDASAEATFARATPAQIAAGKVWYDDAHQFAQDLSSDYGITLEQSAAVLAVISPQMSWERNLEGAKRIIEMHKSEFHLTQTEIDGAYENTVAYASKQGKRGQEIIATAARYRSEALEHVGKKSTDVPVHIVARYTKSGALTANAEKAFRILRGEDPTKVVYEGKGGFKVKSFYDNILDPKGSREVTVDTHIINALVGGGKSPGAKTTAAVFKHPARYELVADSVRRLADTHDMRPHEMQAILWVVQRPTDVYKTLDEETAFVVDLIWQGFSIPEAEFIARNYDEYAVTMKHLSGQHDQQSHAGGKGTAKDFPWNGTSEDAKAYMSEKYPHTKWEGIWKDDTMGKRVYYRLDQLYTDFPEISKRIPRVATLPPMHGGQPYAWTAGGDNNSITFNYNLVGDTHSSANIDRDISYDGLKGWLGADARGVEYIVDHEFGHVITEHFLDPKTPKAMRDKRTAFLREAALPDGTAPHISKYGETSEHEYLAEAFAATRGKRKATHSDEGDVFVAKYDAFLTETIKHKSFAFKHPGHAPQSVHGRRGVGFQRKQDLIKNGGFTYQPVSGTSPKKGLALSVYPDREKIFERIPTASEVKSYIKDNADLLKDKRNHIGGWHDTETGRVYLDVSLVVDSRKEAEKLSREYKQEAYFDLESFETVYTRAREDSDKSRAATLSRDDGAIDAGVYGRGDRGVLARALWRLKHLGGKHDQSTHGRGDKKPTQLEMDLGMPRLADRAAIGPGFGDRFNGDPVNFIANANEGDILEMYGLDDGEHVVLINNRDPDDYMDISLSGPGISLQRQFYPDGRVHHDYFKVTGEKQSEGIAARINARAEEYYMSAGFNRIDLNADIDVGKYAWAKQGYDFEDETHRDWAMERVYEVRAAKVPRGHTDWEGKRPKAWEIAALDDGELYEWSTTSKSGTGHLGKAAMLSGSDWDGIKRLDRDDEGFKVGRAYYASKGVR